MSETSTTHLQNLIERMNRGDLSVRDDLICHVEQRLRRLAGKMTEDDVCLGRWEAFEDVVQQAVVRLLQAIEKEKPAAVAEFFSLGEPNSGLLPTR
jgi:DNA-directed RNA polymerase specialized sigma24 family protein